MWPISLKWRGKGNSAIPLLDIQYNVYLDIQYNVLKLEPERDIFTSILFEKLFTIRVWGRGGKGEIQPSRRGIFSSSQPSCAICSALSCTSCMMDRNQEVEATQMYIFR
jgi:hypothetical protein